MKILLDTNVALDALLNRQPFCVVSSRVLGLSILGVEIFVLASAITDIYYIICKFMGSKKAAIRLLENLLVSVKAAMVSGNEIRRALTLDWNDFEDAVQYAVGESLRVDYIVTRNPADFSISAIPVVTPEGLLSIVVSDPGE
jgi:predicted nucleic acid-binding protein